MRFAAVAAVAGKGGRSAILAKFIIAAANRSSADKSNMMNQLNFRVEFRY